MLRRSSRPFRNLSLVENVALSAFFGQDYNVDYLDLLSPLNGLPPSTLPPELSSLTTMSYQLAFFTPGRFPAKACIRKLY